MIRSFAPSLPRTGAKSTLRWACCIDRALRLRNCPTPGVRASVFPIRVLIEARDSSVRVANSVIAPPVCTTTTSAIIASLGTLCICRAAHWKCLRSGGRRPVDAEPRLSARIIERDIGGDRVGDRIHDLAIVHEIRPRPARTRGGAFQPDPDRRPVAHVGRELGRVRPRERACRRDRRTEVPVLGVSLGRRQQERERERGQGESGERPGRAEP
jgi:hypothetical protein